jgi:hypothetical protein
MPSGFDAAAAPTKPPVRASGIRHVINDAPLGFGEIPAAPLGFGLITYKMPHS